MKEKLEKETSPVRVPNLLPWIESGEYLTPEWQQKMDEIIKRTAGPDIPDKYLAIPSGKSLI